MCTHLIILPVCHLIYLLLLTIRQQFGQMVLIVGAALLLIKVAVKATVEKTLSPGCSVSVHGWGSTIIH